jgi:hypothetical protein
MAQDLTDLTTALADAVSTLELVQIDADLSHAHRSDVEVAVARLKSATVYVSQLTGIGAAAAQSLHARVHAEQQAEGRS